MRFLPLLTAASLLTAAGWLSATTAAAAVPAAANATVDPAAQEVIRAIELRMEQPPERPIREEDFLAFAIGEELTDSAVRRTLSNFYATGLFAEAAVYRRQDPEGLTAVVVLRPVVWIEQVLFENRTDRQRSGA